MTKKMISVCGGPSLCGICRASEARSSLKAQRDCALALFRPLDWRDEGKGKHGFCFVCRRYQAVGHAPDCALAAFLAEVDGGGSP